MISFTYKAKNQKGQIITGTVKAENQVEADKILLDHGLMSLELMSGKPDDVKVGFGGKIKPEELAVFARQLSTMISSGLPLNKGLKIISTQTKRDQIRSLYLEVYQDLEEGLSFSSALAKHPKAFDSVFVSIIAAGESTGKLDMVLNQLADQLESDNNFSSKVRGALLYPAFILAALIGIGIYMLVAVIPQLEAVFASSGAQLPVATRMLISLSNTFQNYWWAIILVFLGLVIYGRYWITSKSGSETLDGIKINIPIFSKLFRGIYMYRFTKVMSMLIGAGVPIIDALKVSGGVLDNSFYAKSVEKIISQIEKGVPLSVQLAKDPIYPDMLAQMAAVGEETGQIDKVFDKVSEYFGQETDQMVKNIASLVEPIVLVIMGIGVAFLVFAVLMPIYNVAQLQ